LSPIRISVLDRIHRGCGGVANAFFLDCSHVSGASRR
jgi:hypothetical protein